MNNYLLTQIQENAERLMQQCGEALTIMEQNQLVDDLDTFLQRELGIGLEDFADYLPVVTGYLERKFPA